MSSLGLLEAKVRATGKYGHGCHCCGCVGGLVVSGGVLVVGCGSVVMIRGLTKSASTIRQNIG